MPNYVINLTDKLGNRIEGLKPASTSVIPGTVTVSNKDYINNDTITIEAVTNNIIFQAIDIPVEKTSENTEGS